MSAAVNINRVRSSGTFQALARDPSISLPLQYLDVPASRLYLRFRRPREGVRPDGDGAPDLPFAEDLDELGLLPYKAGGPQLFRAYRITRDVPELAQVYGRVDRRSGDRVPAARLSLEARQPALQGHLAALVGGVSLRSGPGAGDSSFNLTVLRPPLPARGGAPCGACPESGACPRAPGSPGCA